MAAALDRNRLTGARAFKADEMSTLRAVVSTYGDLLREATHRQFQEACDHTNANIKRILAKKSTSPQDYVIEKG